MKIKNIDMCVGIYDSSATIIRHRSGDVTIKIPYVKWVGNTGVLAFEKLSFDATDERTRTLSDELFTDNDPKEYESLSEFLNSCCADMGY